MIKDNIIKNLKIALGKMGINEEIVLDRPANTSFGDFACSIALKLTKSLKKNPVAIAEEIVKNIPQDKLIKKIEVIKPGFINFWISEKYLFDQLIKINKEKDLYGKLDYLKHKKIMIEFTDPNPFKEFHIGHLYSNTVGESLSRLHEAMGAIVKRANYQGDVGMHVAKSIWGLKKKLVEDKTTINQLEKLSITEKVKYLGQAYALGASIYEENNKIKEEIKDINYLVYISAQEYLEEKFGWKPQINYKKFIEGKKINLNEIKQLYETGRTWSLDYFETIYKRLGTKFDYYYFESQVGEFGTALVKKFLAKGVFTNSKGAVIFQGDKYGLHTRVFINSYGLPTYEAKDLGLAPRKYSDFPYNLSLIVTGNEINEYFNVVLKALEIINPELRKKTRHISHGMVRLPEGKMSSRTGKIISGEWLLNQTKKELLKIIKKSNKLSIGSMDETSEKVAVGALKYSLLKSGIGNNIIFDFNESLSFDGNSGPYLQYTYARCQSVLRQSNSDKLTRLNFGTKLETEELAVLRHIILFPDAIFEAANSLSPNLLCNFLFDLAQKYNLFYQNCPILKAEKDKKELRLLITRATANVIKKGLYLLGIETVEKM